MRLSERNGFAMWDSDVTPWNAADRGPRRDITGELALAVRARGMKFFISFHHARNNLWDRPDRGTEWSGHYAHVMENYPALLEDKERAILYGYMPRDEFLRFWSAKLKEVVDKYHPDIMWFDSWLDQIPDEVKLDYLAYYLNTARARGQAPVVTYKQEDLPQTVGVLDLEKGRMDRLTDAGGYTADDIRYTTRDNAVYAIAMGSPGAGSTITLSAFAAAEAEPDRAISHVYLLGTSESLPYEMTPSGLVITTPDRAIEDLAVVLKIER